MVLTCLTVSDPCTAGMPVIDPVLSFFQGSLHQLVTVGFAFLRGRDPLF